MHRFAQFDEDGTIVGLVEMEQALEGVPGFLLPTDQHAVLELDPEDEEIAKLSTDEIVHGYRVDPSTRKLVPREGWPRAGGADAAKARGGRIWFAGVEAELLGDYDAVVATNARAYAAWTDASAARHVTAVDARAAARTRRLIVGL